VEITPLNSSSDIAAHDDSPVLDIGDPGADDQLGARQTAVQR
jgi:hypothetical protein